MCRHHCGEWGDLDTEDKRSKEEALKDGTRFLNCYHPAAAGRSTP